MIRDRIVVGIRNVALSEKLQLELELTLESAVTRVRQAEASKLQQPLLRSGSEGKGDTPVRAVHKSKPRYKPRKAYQGRQSTGTTSTQPDTGSACTRCGKRPTHDRQHCPARDATCRKCGKRGHYQAVCRSARVSAVDTGSNPSQESSECDAFLGTLGDSPSHGDPWAVTLEMNETPMKLHIDTGADVTVISEQAWRKLGQPALSPPSRTLRGAGTQELSTTGRFTAMLSIDSHAAEEQVYVVKGLHKCLLGRPAIDKLGLVRRISVVDGTDRSPAELFPDLLKRPR